MVSCFFVCLIAVGLLRSWFDFVYCVVGCGDPLILLVGLLGGLGVCLDLVVDLVWRLFGLFVVLWVLSCDFC